MPRRRLQDIRSRSAGPTIEELTEQLGPPPGKPETPIERATGSNGVDPSGPPNEPSLPVQPPPELVQAVVQLIQRVNQLEQVVGGMHQRDSVEIQKLKLKARCEALKRAIEVIPLDSPDAAARIEEVANLFLKWMNEPTPEEPPSQ